MSIVSSPTSDSVLTCKRCRINVASVDCKNCGLEYCIACSTELHVGRAKTHIVVPLVPLNPNFACPDITCHEHNDKIFEYVCTHPTCQRMICVDCHIIGVPISDGRSFLQTMMELDKIEIQKRLDQTESEVKIFKDCDTKDDQVIY